MGRREPKGNARIAGRAQFERAARLSSQCLQTLTDFADVESNDRAIELAKEGADTVLAFRAHAPDPNVERLYLQTLRNDAGEGISGINELDDLIVGNPFDDVVIGRQGRDTLKGQAGADTFVFDRAPGPGNVDRIVDFASSEGDRLLLRGAIFGGLSTGSLAMELFGRSIFDGRGHQIHLRSGLGAFVV